MSGVKRLQAAGGSIAIVCTGENRVKVFELTGLDRVFAIYDARHKALAAFADGG